MYKPAPKATQVWKRHKVTYPILICRAIEMKQYMALYMHQLVVAAPQLCTLLQSPQLP